MSSSSSEHSEAVLVSQSSRLFARHCRKLLQSFAAAPSSSQATSRASRRAQRVDLGDGASARFAAGEAIHTENSHKFSVDDFRSLAARAGYRAERLWLDRNAWFSVHYLVAEE